MKKREYKEQERQRHYYFFDYLFWLGEITWENYRTVNIRQPKGNDMLMACIVSFIFMPILTIAGHFLYDRFVFEVFSTILLIVMAIVIIASGWLFGKIYPLSRRKAVMQHYAGRKFSPTRRNFFFFSIVLSLIPAMVLLSTALEGITGKKMKAVENVQATYPINRIKELISAVSCEPPMPPSDEEMMQHFNTHEAAFNKVYEIMADCTEGSFHYPPLSPDDIIILDSIGQESELPDESSEEQDLPVYGLWKPERILLDSLLAEMGCGFVLVDRQERETADSLKLSLVMPYYSHGIVDAGTSKSFVYDPELRSRRNISITEQGDLNEIYRRTYNDTMLYKPIKGNWYIELDHSR